MEYSLFDHGSMLADGVRMDAYAQALESAITPGCLVLEIGTGTGIMALLACRLGARRVIAVEPDDVIEVARQLARDSGFADRIEFIQGRSSELELARRADLVVSDLRGVLPFYTGHLPAIIDARERLLAPNGVLLPRQDTLSVALAQAPAPYERHIECWALHDRDLDLSAARTLSANSWWKERLQRDALLSSPVVFATLDYRTVSDPGLDVSTRLVVERPGTAYGFCLWFDTSLTEGVGFSNAPSEPEAVYGNAFFPLLHPVEVQRDDEVCLSLRADFAGGEYVWTWGTGIERGGREIAAYLQSTALGVPLTPDLLRRSSSEFAPVVGEEGEAVRRTLEMMSSGVPLGEIAARLEEASPGLFRRDRDALAFVVQLSQKYCL